jgi:hypothetical protein
VRRFELAIFMKNVSRNVLASAAMAGLLSGTAILQGCADGAKTSVAPGQVAPGRQMPVVLDCAGTNACKGLGGCKTDDHACKFLNACKGKGGCMLSKEDIQASEKKQK